MLWIRNFWHLPFKFTFMRSESLASLDAPVCLWPHLAQRSRVAVLRGCSLLAGAGEHVCWRPPPHCSFPHLCQCHLSSASSLLSWILVHHPPNTNNPKQEPRTHTSPFHMCHVDTSCILCVSCGSFVSLTWGSWLVSAWPSPAATHEWGASFMRRTWSYLRLKMSMLHTLQGRQSRSALLFGLFPAPQPHLLSFILQCLTSLSLFASHQTESWKRIVIAPFVTWDYIY